MCVCIYIYIYIYIYVYIYIYIYIERERNRVNPRSHVPSPAWIRQLSWLGRSSPNLEPGTMRVYVTNGPRNGLNIGRKVGPCPVIRRQWVLDSAHTFSQAVHAAKK